MNAKTFLALAAASLLSVGTLSAQKLRIEGGIAGSKLSLGKGSETYTSDVKPGYRVGAALEVKLFPMIYISAGANLSKAGGRFGVLDKYLDDLTGGTFKNDEELNQYFGGLKVFAAPSISMTTVSVPLSLGLRLKPAGILGVSVEAGPYLTYDLKTTVDWGSYSADLTNLSKESLGIMKYSRLGYGIGASATVELSRFYVRGGIEYGLSNRLEVARNEADERALLETAKAQLPPVLGKYLADDAQAAAYLSQGLSALTGSKTRAMQAYVTLGFRI